MNEQMNDLAENWTTHRPGKWLQFIGNHCIRLYDVIVRLLGICDPIRIRLQHFSTVVLCCCSLIVGRQWMTLDNCSRTKAVIDVIVPLLQLQLLVNCLGHQFNRFVFSSILDFILKIIDISIYGINDCTGKSAVGGGTRGGWNAKSQ